MNVTQVEILSNRHSNSHDLETIGFPEDAVTELFLDVKYITHYDIYSLYIFLNFLLFKLTFHLIELA